MKTNFKNLIGYRLGSVDGEVGEITDLYFDDENLTISYLVVETGNWLSSRIVLISPEAIFPREWDARVFPTNLTKVQIETSPDIDTRMPVSRLNEMALQEHYSWNSYWGTGLYGAGMLGVIHAPVDVKKAMEAKKEIDSNEESHLRSINHVIGYKIIAIDGEFGQVVDFIVNDKDWKVEYLVVDTGKWLNNKQLIVRSAWIHEINWPSFAIDVMLPIQRIKDSPQYFHGIPHLETFEINFTTEQ